VQLVSSEWSRYFNIAQAIVFVTNSHYLPGAAERAALALSIEKTGQRTDFSTEDSALSKLFMNDLTRVKPRNSDPSFADC